MIGYKLLSQRKDGSVGPLFMDKRLRLPIGKWITAKVDVCKPGFVFRPGWHILSKPIAPHLSKRGRVWAKVEFKKHVVFERPANQGGKWFLSNRIKILEILQ